MALQKVFTPGYIQTLKNNIKVENYIQESFKYDVNQVKMLSGVSQPEGLLSKLVPTLEGEAQTAIALYEAYSNLSPIFAQQDDLWVYLTHADLFQYVKQRWPIDETWPEERQIKHIENHWHRHSTNFLRTTFAGSWWYVHLTKDETREDMYELTKVFFDTGLDFRLRFGELSFIRYKESMIGILEFLKENPEVYKSNFTARGQYISRYMNMLGGTTQLASLPRGFFKDKMETIKPRLMEITSTNEVQNQNIIL